MNESPFTHSSANSPPSRKRPSAPLVADVKRASAPSRTASAPAGDCTSAGLMMSGSCTSRTSEGAHAVTSAKLVSSSANGRFVMIEIIFESPFLPLEAERQAQREVRRGPEGLERRGRVAGRAECFWIYARVLRPEDTEVAHCECGNEAARVEEPIDPARIRTEAESDFAQADEIAFLEEAGNGPARVLAPHNGARLLEQR